mmetsp:Transcript_33356/g.43937  ORF Transcript_33356/g.43937 Transcript_33356/m.43937 type:complete len:227 (+) Transcript_33356:1112-1792(+)
MSQLKLELALRAIFHSVVNKVHIDFSKSTFICLFPALKSLSHRALRAAGCCLSQSGVGLFGRPFFESSDCSNDVRRECALIICTANWGQSCPVIAVVNLERLYADVVVLVRRPDFYSIDGRTELDNAIFVSESGGVWQLVKAFDVVLLVRIQNLTIFADNLVIEQDHRIAILAHSANFNFRDRNLVLQNSMNDLILLADTPLGESVDISGVDAELLVVAQVEEHEA